MKVLLAGLLLAAPLAPQAAPAKPALDARALFLANCAACHGESGDGQGWTKLDRRARSFKAGGFSFGNTPEALLRTINTGIPGTPMPGFERALDEASRKALADYVITLGPPIEAVDEERTELVVGERPLVVRGYLPPLSAEEGAAPGVQGFVRSLLVGLCEGLAFQYRADDLRLVAVRQGRFVDRPDWTGRGGSALEPLGRVLLAPGGGNPDPLVSCARRAARGGASAERVSLLAELAETSIRGQSATVEAVLRDPATKVAVARYSETLSALQDSLGLGWRRSLRLSLLAEDLADFSFQSGVASGAQAEQIELSVLVDPHSGAAALHCRTRADGSRVVVRLQCAAGPAQQLRADALGGYLLEPQPGCRELCWTLDTRILAQADAALERQVLTGEVR